MDINFNKISEHKILGNTINVKVSAIKNYIEILKQQITNMQLRYRINELQETFKITKEVNVIYQDLVKKKLEFYEKIINNYMLSYAKLYNLENNNLNLL